LSTKIHATVDALGNPTDFFVTGGEAHDLVGADHLGAVSDVVEIGGGVISEWFNDS
jgi:hypothetical protein